MLGMQAIPSRARTGCTTLAISFEFPLVCQTAGYTLLFVFVNQRLKQVGAKHRTQIEWHPVQAMTQALSLRP